jgi:hypothetical protein
MVVWAPTGFSASGIGTRLPPFHCLGLKVSASEMQRTPTREVVNRSGRLTEMRAFEATLILVGLVVAGLAVVLPTLMEDVINRRGSPGLYLPVYLRTLTPFITTASMASSFVAAAVILSFEKSRPTRASILLGSLAFCVLAVEVALSAYLSFVRPVGASQESILAVYWLIGLVPFGLACTMFTLASIISRRAR